MFDRLAHLARSLTNSRHRRRQLWYMPVLGVAMALMMLRLIWLANWLPMNDFASLAFGMLLSTGLGILGALGLQPMLQRDLPGMLVHGQEAQGRRLLLQTCVVAGGCFLLVLPFALLRPLSSGYSAPVWAAGLLHGLAQQFFLIATTDSRSRGDPLRFALDNLYRAVAALAVAWPIAVTTGSAPLVLAAEALVSFALSALTMRRALRRSGPGLLTSLREAVAGMGQIPWRSAGLLLAVSLLGHGLLNLDRWVAGAWLDKPQFAQYAFVAIGLMIAQSVQSLLNAAVFPLVARRRATQGTPAAHRIAHRLSLASLVVGALLAPIVVLVAQQVVSIWLPQYLPALPLAWPLCALAVLRLADFYSTFLVVSQRERALTYVNSAIFATAGVAVWVLTRYGATWQLDPLWQVSLLALGLGSVQYLAVGTMSWRLRHDPITTQG
jgi:O-antigen/teichoic acid export membrane protein